MKEWKKFYKNRGKQKPFLKKTLKTLMTESKIIFQEEQYQREYWNQMFFCIS